MIKNEDCVKKLDIATAIRGFAYKARKLYSKITKWYFKFKLAWNN